MSAEEKLGLSDAIEGHGIAEDDHAQDGETADGVEPHLVRIGHGRDL